MKSFRQHITEKVSNKGPFELIFSKDIWIPVMRNQMERLFRQNLPSLFEKVPNFVDKYNKNLIWLNVGHGTIRTDDRVLLIKILSQAFFKAKNIFFGSYERKLLSNPDYTKHLKDISDVKPSQEYKIFSFIQKMNDRKLLSELLMAYVAFSQKFVLDNKQLFDRIVKQV